MRILISSSSPPDRGSGINASVNQLCETLASLGHDIHYLSPRPSDTAWLDDYGIQHLEVGRNDVPEDACLSILRYLDQNKIDAGSKADARKKIGVDRDCFLALYVGAIDENRRLETLIEAVKPLA